ncbi:MAG: hypothetical protein KJO98_12605 [Rhodothermia bacterium]|nr:hypothetical protein [Rhodothermia bacterium]
MGKFLRAIVVTSAATAAALVVVSAFRKAAADDDESQRTQPVRAGAAEVDADTLSASVRQDLVTELEGHV